MFLLEDRRALARAAEVRRLARTFVERVPARLPHHLRSMDQVRISKVREDSDRVGVFLFLPALGNAWFGILLEGHDALRFRVEIPAENIVQADAQLVEQDLSRDGAHYIGRIDLIGEWSEEARVDQVTRALARWLDACATVAAT